MQAQWEKLGFTDGTIVEQGRRPASELIATRFDYNFSLEGLAISALVVVAYFVIVFHWSKKQYRDVIAERFDARE